ncbi:MAG: helix-turn-helix domain-containing protein [Eggerthellaceae bacterium]|nr:helix-turn-helix domain-containing protein [Eggerthellaceae bacterium]
MRLNMTILAEGLTDAVALSQTAETLELTLSGVCPLASWTGEGCDEIAFVAAESEACSVSALPSHLLVACDPNSSREHLEELCTELATGTREVACVASTGDMPQMLMQAWDIISRFQTWDERLVSAIVRGAGVQEVLDVVAEGLANPIALFDSASVLIAHAGELPDGWEKSIWGDVIGRGFVPMEHYSADERRLFQRWASATREPIVASPSKGHGETELTCTIELGGSVFAMLAQVDLAHPFSPAQRALVAHVRDRMEVMYQAQIGSHAHKDELAHCLRMILLGRPQDPSVTRFHLRTKGWSDSDIMRVVRVPLPQDMIETGRDQAQLSRARITFPKALVLMHDETIVLVCRDKDYSVDALDRQLARLSHEMDVTVAVSDAFPGIAHATTAYRQCLAAHEVARIQELRGVIAFADAALPAFVEAIVTQDRVEELIDPRVSAVADISQGLELVENLRTYLTCGCNAAKAAKRLFMHRNTLDYRIARIEKTMAVSLPELSEEAAVRMILSCLLIRRLRQGR